MMIRLADVVPIPTDIISDVADHRAVSETDEVRAPFAVDEGLVEIISVDSERWTRMAERLGLSDAVRTASKAAHATYARRSGTEERVLAERDALVMPAHVLSGLTRAGLSP